MPENVFLNIAKTGESRESSNSRSLSIAKVATSYQVKRNRIEENPFPFTKDQTSIANLGGVE